MRDGRLRRRRHSLVALSLRDILERLHELLNVRLCQDREIVGGSRDQALRSAERIEREGIVVGLARAGVNGVGNKLLAFAKNLKSRLDAVLHEPRARRLRPALLLGSADEKELRCLADSHGCGGQGGNKRDGQLVERTGKIGVALDVGVHGANGVVAHAAENAHTLFWDVLRALLFGERMILPALTKTSLRAGDDLTDLVAHVDELGALNANGVRHSPSSLRMYSILSL